MRGQQMIIGILEFKESLQSHIALIVYYSLFELRLERKKQQITNNDRKSAHPKQRFCYQYFNGKRSVNFFRFINCVNSSLFWIVLFLKNEKKNRNKTYNK